MTLTRRQTLAAAAALPMAAALPHTATAEAPMMGPAQPNFRRIVLGGKEITVILAGTTPREDPQSIFGMNVSAEDFAEVSRANFLSTEVSQFFFQPVVVNTGPELVLFDTGLNAGATLAALGAAGYAADQVDKVVLTHMHGDHIGGLMQDGAPTYPNADYMTGRTEFDHWAAQENEGFEANVRPLTERMIFLEDEGQVASGISGMNAFGHTPGHMVFRVEDGDAAALIFADTANHPVWSLANPDWEVRFDADKAAAAEARRRIFTMVAEERMPAMGYHMPFPGIGFVEAAGDGFRWVPEGGQLAG